MTALARPRISSATSFSCAGLWHRTTASQRSATYAFDPGASPPSSPASACARPWSTSATHTGSRQPRASALAMLPAPMSPTFIAGQAYGRARRRRLGLVEEALLDQPRAFLGADLDVARREQEHLVGDPLHATVERVGEARGEVDQALREIGVGALEVEDHRDRVLELVRDLLRVVEALRHHEVDLDAAAVAPAAAVDRAQHARLARRARRLVGEDVVDLVAAAARLEPAHVRALGVALLELALGLRLGLVVVALVRLGEAEVDERLVPCVPEGHTRSVFAGGPGNPFVYKLQAGNERYPRSRAIRGRIRRRHDRRRDARRRSRRGAHARPDGHALLHRDGVEGAR